MFNNFLINFSLVLDKNCYKGYFTRSIWPLQHSRKAFERHGTWKYVAFNCLQKNYWGFHQHLSELAFIYQHIIMIVLIELTFCNLIISQIFWYGVISLLRYCEMTTELIIFNNLSYHLTCHSSCSIVYTVVCILVRMKSFPRFWRNHP